jgi:hypothetical protein
MTLSHWRDTELAEVLEALRQAEADVDIPPRVEAALLAAWDDAAHAQRTASHSRRLWREAGAVAAAVTIAVGLWQLGQQLERTTRRATERAEDGRTLLLVGEPILQGEPVRVVRMRVPASTLTSLGERSTERDAAEHVDVDVIVGEDGVARAVRLGM